MICTIASTKGGVGKTTVAVNLAISLLKDDKQVIVLDADRQGSISKLNYVRNAIRDQGESIPEIQVASAEGSALIDIAVTQSEKGKFVLIDSQGANTKSVRQALLRSDLVLTISAPSTLDLWEVSEIIQLAGNASKVRKKKLPVALLFNKVSTHRKVTSLEDSKDYLEQNLIVPDHIFDAVIRDRISFQHSLREGKAISEFTPSDKNAINEMTNFYTEFQQYLNKI